MRGAAVYQVIWHHVEKLWRAWRPRDAPRDGLRDASSLRWAVWKGGRAAAGAIRTGNTYHNW